MGLCPSSPGIDLDLMEMGFESRGEMFEERRGRMKPMKSKEEWEMKTSMESDMRIEKSSSSRSTFSAFHVQDLISSNNPPNS